MITNIQGAVWLQQKELWNTAMTLLSPQQRLVPYRADMWTRLWDAAHSKPSERFNPSQVADKLMLSLLCYQVLYDLEINFLNILKINAS